MSVHFTDTERRPRYNRTSTSAAEGRPLGNLGPNLPQSHFRGGKPKPKTKLKSKPRGKSERKHRGSGSGEFQRLGFLSDGFFISASSVCHLSSAAVKSYSFPFCQLCAQFYGLSKLIRQPWMHKEKYVYITHYLNVCRILKLI